MISLRHKTRSYDFKNDHFIVIILLYYTQWTSNLSSVASSGIAQCVVRRMNRSYKIVYNNKSYYFRRNSIRTQTRFIGNWSTCFIRPTSDLCGLYRLKRINGPEF